MGSVAESSVGAGAACRPGKCLLISPAGGNSLQLCRWPERAMQARSPSPGPYAPPYSSLHPALLHTPTWPPPGPPAIPAPPSEPPGSLPLPAPHPCCQCTPHLLPTAWLWGPSTPAAHLGLESSSTYISPHYIGDVIQMFQSPWVRTGFQKA